MISRDLVERLRFRETPCQVEDGVRESRNTWGTAPGRVSVFNLELASPLFGLEPRQSLGVGILLVLPASRACRKH